MHTFISHASEDKDEFVRSLAKELVSNGVEVWYDEFSLQLGDRLRESIDRGLARSRFCVVVLSEHFFNKRWTVDELEGVFSMGNEITILPVWLGVDFNFIKSKSPMLAGRLAAKGSDGVEAVASQIKDSIIRHKEFLRIWETRIKSPSGGSVHLETICNGSSETLTKYFDEISMKSLHESLEAQVKSLLPDQA